MKLYVVVHVYYRIRFYNPSKLSTYMSTLRVDVCVVLHCDPVETFPSFILLLKSYVFLQDLKGSKYLFWLIKVSSMSPYTI